MAMQTFEDDELNDVKTPAPAARPAAAAAAAAPAQAHQPKQQPRQAVADDFDDDMPKVATKAEDDSDIHDTDFDDEKVYSRPGQLNRIRPDKGRAVRIAFIKSVKMKSAKSHFVEIGTGKDAKKGKYRCLIPVGSDEQGWCCTKLAEDSTTHIVALVLVYTNADPTTGKYSKGADGHVPPIEQELGYVDLSGFNMKQIKKLPDEDQTPYDIDIIMTHAEGRAFGYEFNRASNKARWHQNPELVKEVEAACERFRDGKALIYKLGKKLNLIEWKALLSGVSGGEEKTLENMDEL
jgi:hypothetical protein